MKKMKNINDMNIEDILTRMSREEILDALREDENYYGDFGQQFLSNSNIGQLKNGEFNKPMEPNINLLIGGAFHTMMLEPHKMGKYKFINCSTRNTKIYKEESKGELTMITKDLNLLNDLREVLETHPFEYEPGKKLVDLVRGGEAEVPGYAKIMGEYWKGKADVLNHEAKLVVDLKTTSNIEKFKDSATKFNYDSQAWIYRELFDYDVAFLVFCKKTLKAGFFECSDDFYASGREKVVEAVYSYRSNIKKI